MPSVQAAETQSKGSFHPTTNLSTLEHLYSKFLKLNATKIYFNLLECISSMKYIQQDVDSMIN